MVSMQDFREAGAEFRASVNKISFLVYRPTGNFCSV